MMEIFKPPLKPTSFSKKSVFLAGSIEMGKAIDWQAYVQQQFESLDILILNPRRDDWDSSWKQSKDNPHFRGQVEWELEMLNKCDIIMMYLDPDTMSPISLLELGLFAKSGKLIVCCPDMFYRKGNVDIVCEQNGIPVVDNLETLVEMTAQRLQ